MLLVQKFHSIHEIDPEFIPGLELLLQAECPNFKSLVQQQDAAPLGDTFTYFLFFGPTQNAPVGFAQLRLRALPGDDLVGWEKKVFQFWNKEHRHWKQLTWRVGLGSAGPWVIDARYARSGKEKMQEILREYEQRSEMKTQEIYFHPEQQELKSSWTPCHQWQREVYHLGPWKKQYPDYQAYLNSIPEKLKQEVSDHWRRLHQKAGIQLGDYLQLKDIKGNLPLAPIEKDRWAELGASVLTFEKSGEILGCLMVLKGQGGHFFVEPIPFESEASPLVPDAIYLQYALIKMFEIPHAKFCHILKRENKLQFSDDADLDFFTQQGFTVEKLSHQFKSLLPQLEQVYATP